jgi:DNA-binding transcriptional MerR regulator
MTGSEGRFDDGKSAAALRTIGEVSKALGIRQHVLRYWEEQFPMLRPLKRSGGRRYYRPDDVALVESIDRLVHREGYTLKGARMALSARGAAAEVVPVSAIATPPEADDGEVLRRLVAIRAELAAALSA